MKIIHKKVLSAENTWAQEVDSDMKGSHKCILTMEVEINSSTRKKHGKAAGQPGVVNEMLTTSCVAGLYWLTDLCKTVNT